MHARAFNSVQCLSSLAAGRAAWHWEAGRLGFTAWRQALSDACSAQPRAVCTEVSPGWGNDLLPSHRVLSLYASATFCLQPPGDMLARSGIIDAMSAGCIPVFFHPGQLGLWPAFWNASAAAVAFDWSLNHSEPFATRKTAAAEALLSLRRMPHAAIRARQRAIRAALPALLYARVHQRGDAVDVLVRELSRLIGQRHRSTFSH